MPKTGRTAAIVTVIALLLVPVAVLATDTTELTLRPEVEGRTAVRSGQTVVLEGEGPPGRLDGARLVGIEADGDEIVEPLGEFAVNGSPSRSTYVRNDDGAITGRIALGCLFSDPAVAGCNPSEDGIRDVVLEVDLHGETIRTAPLRVDYTHPEIRGYALVGPQRLLVTLTEPVTHPDGREDPRDYEIEEPDAVVTGIGGPAPGDCTYGAGEDARAGDTGCTRVLHLATALDRDATPTVGYFPGFPRRKYVDGAGNEAFISSDTRARSVAVDRVPPVPPTIERVDGQAPAGEAATVLGSDATPSVHVSGVRQGHQVDLLVDGERVERTTTDGSTVTFELRDGLADGTYRIEARAHDRALCDPADPAAGECANGSGPSSAVTYDLDTVAPRVTTVTSPGDHVVVELSERLVGEGGDPAQWRITLADGSAGPAVTEVTGTDEVRTLALDAALEGAATLRYDGGDAPHVDPHGNTLSPVAADIDLVPVPVATLLDTVVDESAGELAFVVSLTDPVPDGSEAVVTIDVSAGSAELGADVELPEDLQVTIPAGAARGTLSLVLVDDALDEADETLVAEITAADGADVAGASALATIRDDDAAPTLRATDVEVAEGDVATVTVELDAVSGRPVDFDWATVPGTAGGGWDYVEASGDATIAPGETSTTVTVRTLDDLLDEHPETLAVALSDIVNAVAPTDAATVTLADDDATPAVRLSDLRMLEGDAGEGRGHVRATLDAPSGRDVVIVWATRDGSATAGGDYRADEGELVVPAGATGGDLPVTVLGDAIPEDGDETFEVVIVDVVDVDVTDGTGVVTIVEDDVRQPGDGVGDADPLEDLPAPDAGDVPSDVPSEDASEDPTEELPGAGDLPGGDGSEEPSEDPSDEPPSDDPADDPTVGPSDHLPGTDDLPSVDPSDGPSDGPPGDSLPGAEELPDTDDLPGTDGPEEPSDAPSEAPSDEPGDRPSEEPSGVPVEPVPGADDLPSDPPGDDASDGPGDDPSEDPGPDPASVLPDEAPAPDDLPEDAPSPDGLPDVLGDELGRDDEDRSGDDTGDGTHDGEGDGGDGSGGGSGDDPVLGAPTAGERSLPRTGGGLGALALLAALGGALRRRRD